jgi:predicted dithiol-disulfide oxidoreductase (DUF899 family)
MQAPLHEFDTDYPFAESDAGAGSARQIQLSELFEAGKDSGRWPPCSSGAAAAIHHFWSSELWFAGREEGQDPRHVEFMWPLWAVLDHTPAGRGTDWGPQLEY